MELCQSECQKSIFFFDLEVIAVSPIGFYSDTDGEGRGYSVPENSLCDGVVDYITFEYMCSVVECILWH